MTDIQAPACTSGRHGPRGRGYGPLLLILLLLSAPVAAIEGYAEAAVGLTLVDVEQPLAVYEQDQDVTIAAEALFAGGGVRWLPFLSTGLCMWIWGDRQVNTSSQEQELDGYGFAADVTVRLPLHSVSPYARYSRVCWDMIITGLESSWSEEECSPMTTLGIGFGLDPAGAGGQGITLEYSRMTLRDDTESVQLMVTVQAPF